MRASHNNNLLITGDIENQTLQSILQTILNNYQASISHELFAYKLSNLQQYEACDVNEKFDIQRFWNMCYLKFVCKVSGPGIYNMPIYEEKIVMMDLFYRK